MERSLKKNRIFLDTVYILALTNRRDQYHQLASKLVSQFVGYSMATTDAILLEVGNALARSHRQEAAKAIQQLLTSDDVEVVHLSPQLFERGLALYTTHQDKVWSLVDCISFIVMTEADIAEALTTDRHFEQAGFRALMNEHG
jgi:predicted nucleic acid-binding protein